MTEQGQTDDYSVSDHLKAIIDHCGQGVVDYCLYDTGEIIPEIIKKYNMEGQDLVEQNVDKVKGVKFLQRSLAVVKGTKIRHDANLVATAIIELVCDDLRYQDKQNDPQYLMLNTKLKEDKRIEKLKKSTEKRNKSRKIPKPKGQSKFSQKYSDRIQSIKDSGEKSKKRKQKAIAKAKSEKAAKAKAKVQAKSQSKTPQEIREEMLKMYKQTKKENNKE